MGELRSKVVHFLRVLDFDPAKTTAAAVDAAIEEAARPESADPFADEYDFADWELPTSGGEPKPSPVEAMRSLREAVGNVADAERDLMAPWEGEVHGPAGHRHLARFIEAYRALVEATEKAREVGNGR